MINLCLTDPIQNLPHFTGISYEIGVLAILKE